MMNGANHAEASKIKDRWSAVNLRECKIEKWLARYQLTAQLIVPGDPDE
jgi:hypothetical protein